MKDLLPAQTAALDLEDMQVRLRSQGLLSKDEHLSKRDWDVIAYAVDLCAGIGDRYRDEDRTCGDEIRARFGIG